MKTQNQISFQYEVDPAAGVTIVDVIAPDLEAIEELEIPQSVIVDGKPMPVTSIALQRSARNGLSNLKTVVLPEGLKVIGQNCFIGMKIGQVNFPSTLKEIGDLAFTDCKHLSAAIMPEGLEVIGEYAFSNVGSHPSRTRVYVPSTAEMRESAFSSSRLGRTEVCCPVIGTDVFESVVFSSLKLGKQVRDIQDYAFERSNALYLLGSLPAGIRHIGNGAFSKAYPGYAKHYSISIPDGVSVGSGLFRNSTRLRKVVTGDATWKALMQATSTFSDTDIEEVIIPQGTEGLGASVCASCKRLKSINIPNSVTMIGMCAFWLSGLEWVNLPASLLSIGEDAFAQMLNCKYIDAPAKIWGELLKGSAIAANAMNHISVPEGVDTIGSMALRGCHNLYTVSLPKTLRIIGIKTFENCTMLQELDIPQGVEVLHSEAFNSCYSLRKVTLHEGLEVIHEKCFKRCRSLNSLDIPSTVSNIGYGAFSDCCSLQKLVLRHKPSKRAYPLDCSESVDWYVPDEYVNEAKELCADCGRRILPLSQLQPLEPLPKEQAAPAGMKRVRIKILFEKGSLLLRRKVEPEHLPLIADHENAGLLLSRYLLEGFNKFDVALMCMLDTQNCQLMNKNYSNEKTYLLSEANLQSQPTPWGIDEPTLVQPFDVDLELYCSFFLDKDEVFDISLLKFDYSKLLKNNCMHISRLCYNGQWHDCQIFVGDINVAHSRSFTHCIEDYNCPAVLYGHNGELELIMNQRYQLSVEVPTESIKNLISRSKETL